MSSLLKEYLSKDDTLFIYTTNIQNVFPNKDIYIVITSDYEDLEVMKAYSGLKILISDVKAGIFIKKALECGFSVFYDFDVSLNELSRVGLHLYIYQIGSCDIDYDKIVKIVTQDKHFKRRYGKIQI